jgi:hypothetical protein
VSMVALLSTRPKTRAMVVLASCPPWPDRRRSRARRDRRRPGNGSGNLRRRSTAAVSRRFDPDRQWASRPTARRRRRSCIHRGDRGGARGECGHAVPHAIHDQVTRRERCRRKRRRRDEKENGGGETASQVLGHEIPPAERVEWSSVEPAPKITGFGLRSLLDRAAARRDETVTKLRGRSDLGGRADFCENAGAAGRLARQTHRPSVVNQQM